MADVYLALSGNEFVAPEDGYPKALAATRVALELDPALPAARTALGFVTGFFTGDVPAAMNEFNIACAIDPHWANAEYFAGMLALNVGDFDTATARLRRALELAPLSAPITANMGRPLLCMGRYDEAIEWARRGLELDPNFWISHLLHGWALEGQRRFEDARRAFARAERCSHRIPAALASIAYCDAAAGLHDRARATVARLVQERRSRYVSAVRIARIHVALGDRDKAFRWLHQAIDDRSLLNNCYVTYDHAFEPLKADSRFQTVLAQYFCGR